MKEIKLYTTKICPFCIQAKMLLKKLDLTFEETDLGQDPELRARLSSENGGWRTVPMIFIGEDFVGGFTELANLHKSGELMKKVQGG